MSYVLKIRDTGADRQQGKVPQAGVGPEKKAKAPSWGPWHIRTVGLEVRGAC
jgi:hypothetical protein